MDAWLDRWAERSPIAAVTFCAVMSFGGFGLVIGLAIWGVQDKARRDREWWADYRISQHCHPWYVVQPSSGFLQGTPTEIAWKCDREIVVRPIGR